MSHAADATSAAAAALQPACSSKQVSAVELRSYLHVRIFTPVCMAGILCARLWRMDQSGAEAHSLTCVLAPSTPLALSDCLSGTDNRTGVIMQMSRPGLELEHVAVVLKWELALSVRG